MDEKLPQLPEAKTIIKKVVKNVEDNVETEVERVEKKATDWIKKEEIRLRDIPSRVWLKIAGISGVIIGTAILTLLGIGTSSITAVVAATVSIVALIIAILNA